MPTQTYIVDANMTGNLEAKAISAAVALRGLDGGIAAMTANLGNATAAMTSIVAQLNAFIASAGKAQQATQGATSSLGGFGTAMVAIHAGVALMREFGQEAERGKESLARMADEEERLRDALREVAVLQGKSGPDNQVVAETVELGMASGLMPQAAAKFEEQWLGAIPAARQKGNIDGQVKPGEASSVEEQAKLIAAQFGNRRGLSPATSGELGASLGHFAAIPDAQTMAKLLEQTDDGLTEGKFTSEPLARAYMTARATLLGPGGGFSGDDELAPIFGAMTTHTGSPMKTKTLLEAAAGAVSVPQNATNAAYFKKVDIQDSDDTRTRWRKIGDDFRANGNGVGFATYMERAGFKDDLKREGLKAVYDEEAVIDQRVRKTRTLDGSKLLRDNQEFLTRNPTGVRSMVRAGKAGRDIITSEKAEWQRAGMAVVEEQMVANGEIDPNRTTSTWGEWLTDKDPMRWGSSDGEWTRDQTKRKRWIGHLEKEGLAHGMTQEQIDEILERRTVWGGGGQKFDPDAMSTAQDRARRSGKLAFEVQKRGGDVAGALPAQTVAEFKNMANASKELQKSIDNLNQTVKDRQRREQQPGFVGPPTEVTGWQPMMKRQ